MIERGLHAIENRLEANRRYIGMEGEDTITPRMLHLVSEKGLVRGIPAAVRAHRSHYFGVHGVYGEQKSNAGSTSTLAFDVVGAVAIAIFPNVLKRISALPKNKA